MVAAADVEEVSEAEEEDMHYGKKRETGSRRRDGNLLDGENRERVFRF